MLVLGRTDRVAEVVAVRLLSDPTAAAQAQAQYVYHGRFVSLVIERREVLPDQARNGTGDCTRLGGRS